MRIYICACFLLIVTSYLVSCSNNSATDYTDIPVSSLTYTVKRELLNSICEKDTLCNLALLKAFYSKNNYNAYWFSLNKMDDLNLFNQFIQSVPNYGLNSNFYNSNLLKRFLPNQIDSTYILKDWNSDTLLAYDVIVSISFIKLIKHLYNGVITEPELADGNWFHTPKILSTEQFEVLVDTLHHYGFVAVLNNLKINSLKNIKLKEELISLKKYYDLKGWPIVEYGKSLKPKDTDQRILSIRERLLKQEFIQANDSSAIYDEELELAVISFQKKFNLIADGVIGKATIDAMNIPVSSRIKSVVVSMERNRWLPFEYGEECIISNIAGFNLNYYKDDTVFYSTKAIVGRVERPTPAFNDTMTYVELNPYWTIPPTILEEDVIPHILKDSSYLSSKKIRVLTMSGQEIHPDSVDWKRINPKRVPFKLKKDPGPQNDLGRVKFMFPNRHMIYFHDTPSKYLFASNVTAFSSGCVRIQDPYDFAKALFHDHWKNDSIVDEVKKGSNKIIKLDHSILVYLIYQTVWVSENGDVIYGNDIYAKDESIFSMLHYELKTLDAKSRKIIELDSALIQ